MVSLIVIGLFTQTLGVSEGEYCILGKQVATEISSRAQSLPPPPGALFLSVNVKDVSDGPVRYTKPLLTQRFVASEPVGVVPV